MSSKEIIYGKKMDDTAVPMTVRVEWLPDGTIKPLMLWTSDQSCLQIKHIYEATPLAFLKDRGEGLRFKVRAEITDTSEACDEHFQSGYEIYLYLADNRFCGKNMIDNRYEHKGKQYIPVTMDIFPNGKYEIVYFRVKNSRYMVERTLEVDARGSYYAGGVGIWHKVEARLVNENDDNDPDQSKSVYRIAALYFEINKWFVHVRSA